MTPRNVVCLLAASAIFSAAGDSLTSTPSVSALLSAGKVTEAVNLADPRGTRALADGALNGAEWIAAYAGVSRTLGRPHADAADAAARIEFVTVTLPDGRELTAHSRAAVALPAGERVPLRGMLFDGVFYASEHAHACSQTAAGLECAIGGALPALFETEAAAAAAAASERAAAHAAFRGSFGLRPFAGLRDDSDGLGATLAVTNARVLQLGAANNASMPTYGSASTNSRGTRTVVCIDIFFSDQTASTSTVIPLATMTTACSNTKLYHERRSFGAVKLAVTTKQCLYQLSTVSSASPTTAAIMTAAKAALQAGTGSCAADSTTYNHYIVFQPQLASFKWAGLGSWPGSSVWINGITAASDEGGLRVVAHELGHNYGLSHCSFWALGSSTNDEYGDTSDVMGNGLGMSVADYQAGVKAAMGWIPASRVVNVNRASAGVSAGTVTSGVFYLAPSDRDGTSGDDFVKAIGRARADVAFTVRAAVPPRWFLNDGMQGVTSQHAYLTYRARLSKSSAGADYAGQGVYLNELAVGTNGISNPYLFCYRDPFCKIQRPITSYDAVVWNANETRLLVEVGGAEQMLGTDPVDDAALRVRVALLGTDGLPLDRTIPFGCTATDCATLPTIVSVTTAGVYPASFSALHPVAVFKVTSASGATIVSASTCASGVSYPAAAGLSAFFGSFPASHAYYGGNVGMTGDVNAPSDDLDASWYPATNCFSTSFPVAAGATVWVVVGSPGAARGTEMSGSVTFTYGGALSGSSFPVVSPPASGTCSYKTKTFTALPKSGSDLPVFATSDGSRFIRYSAYYSGWIVDDVTTDAANAQSGYYCTVWSGSTLSALSGHFVCPPGSYRSGNGCTKCPLASQTSSAGASNATDCYCPLGWYASGSACVGPQVGGPSATAAELVSTSCPLNTNLTNGQCVSCPLFTGGPQCSDTPFYETVEIVQSGGFPSSANYRGVYKWNGAYANGKPVYKKVGGVYFWFWTSYDSAWNSINSEAGVLAASYVEFSNSGYLLVNQITSASLAFCNGEGPAFDFDNRRLCYCGEGRYLSGSKCVLCAAGTYRSIGGSLSKTETCTPCASGTVSAAGASACANTCSAGTTLSGSTCTRSSTCAIGSAPDVSGSCVACGPGFAGDGSRCSLCAAHQVATTAGSCACAPGYATNAAGACVPPSTVAFASANFSASSIVTFSISRIQYTPATAPYVNSVVGASAGARVWLATPVYVAANGANSTLYYAHGGAWGQAASAPSTALFGDLLAVGASPTAGAGWDISPNPALYTQDSGVAPLTPFAPTPYLSAGFAAHAVAAAPLETSGARWFMYSAQKLRSFVRSTATTLTAGAAAAAPMLVSGTGTFYDGNRVRLVFAGLVGTGDRVALSSSTNCADVVDSITNTFVASLDASLGATLTVPSAVAGWTVCVRPNPSTSSGTVFSSVVWAADSTAVFWARPTPTVSPTNAVTISAGLSPSPSNTPLVTPSSGSAVLRLSLVFSASSGAVFTAAMQGTIIVSAATALGVPRASIGWLGVTNSSESGISRRLQSGGGTRVQLSVSPAAASASSSIATLVGSGSSLTAAVTSVLSTGFSTALAAQPDSATLATALGYGSTSAMVASLSLDSSIPITAVVMSATPSPSPLEESNPSNGTGGLVVGALFGAVFAVYVLTVSVIASCVHCACCSRHEECKARYSKRSVWLLFCGCGTAQVAAKPSGAPHYGMVLREGGGTSV